MNCDRIATNPGSNGLSLKQERKQDQKNKRINWTAAKRGTYCVLSIQQGMQIEVERRMSAFHCCFCVLHRALALTPMMVLGATTELVANHRDFADQLVADLYQADNECTSSLGISMAFDLVFQAADLTNHLEMQKVFGYPADATSLVWQETQQRLTSAYDGSCLSPLDATTSDQCDQKQPTLAIANRVWMSDSIMVEDAVSQKLGSNLFQMDFNSGDAGSVINEWVDDSTRGLVKSIVGDGPLLNVQVVAVNSIYLKASWVTQFSKEATNIDVFFTSPSRLETLPSQVNYMHAVHSYPYSDKAVKDFQIVQLPLRGSLSMIFALPAVEDATPVGSQDVLDAVSQLSMQRVALALPKFRFESTYEENLKSSLIALGLERVFQGGLCFGGEAGCNGKVSEILHKTVIDVNEQGVEAAAVTALFARLSSPLGEPEVPILFLANHPFQFFIYESEEGLVLFEGRVEDPGATKEPETPNLLSQHADTGFWKDQFDVEPREMSGASSLRSCLVVCSMVLASSVVLFY